jgi:hypothetical protein
MNKQEILNDEVLDDLEAPLPEEDEEIIQSTGGTTNDSKIFSSKSSGLVLETEKEKKALDFLRRVKSLDPFKVTSALVQEMNCIAGQIF